MDSERVEFGNQLRVQRESRALTLLDVVRVTKIPERSLANLEEGNFAALPADVFVRGFLRSYCRCVGVDPEATIRRWAELARRSGRAHDAYDTPGFSLVKVASREPRPATEAAPAVVKPAGADVEMTLMQALSEAGKGTSRVSLTLAVIILVIVATLTLSLLLRRPSHVGDGVSRIDTTLSERLG